MNEVKRVHLGRQQFIISVEAHRVLRDYLAAIEKQPGVQAEVVKEVEMRMAELLHERGISGEKVVLPEDIAFLKEQLGEPRDFKDDEDESDAANAKASTTSPKDETDEQPKRLYRDTQNGIVAGVASGLAAYLGIDVIFIRIAFVALTFASGAGVLLYILIWLLAPEAKTPSERLQMQGKAVTVDSLKQIVDRADIAGVSERAGRKFGSALGKVLEVAARAALALIGIGFVIGGTVIMLGTIAMGVYMLIHGGQIGTEVAFPLGSREVWLVILAIITIGIFGFFMLMVGLTMITRKWRLPSWSVAALLGIFFVAGSVGTALGFDAAPHLRERFRQAHHSQLRDLPEFTSINLNGRQTTFSFKPDSKYYVEVQYLGNESTKPLTTTVENGVLKVDTNEFMKTPLCTGICFYSEYDLKVIVHAPSLSKVDLSGTGNSFSVADLLTQTNPMTIEMQRYTFGDLRFEHMHPAQVQLTSDSNSPTRTLVLQGFKKGTNQDDTIYADEHTVYVTAADAFLMKTADACDEYAPLATLYSMPTELKVNDMLVRNSDELRAKHSADQANSYNCVAGP